MLEVHKPLSGTPDAELVIPPVSPTATELLILLAEFTYMHRLLMAGGLLLSAAVIVPVAARADDRNHHERRYYDRDGRDYHTWNDREDREYRQYLVERHRQYVVFAKVRNPQRREYFRWRHEHGFKVEIR
jgi:hypothetical protein